jgi:hypothetical protein
MKHRWFNFMELISQVVILVPEETKGRLLEDSMHEILEKSVLLKYHNEYPYDQGVNITFHLASKLCSTR